MSEDSRAAIERIRKLLNMTRANGCTEAEAIAAAEKVARLMEELGLVAGDVEMTADRVGKKRGGKSVRATLWGAISVCTNTAVMIFADGIEYLGRAPGPEIAVYLHLVTDRAIDRELKVFRATSWYKRRRTLRAKRVASDDFTTALVTRLSNRLFEQFAATISPDARALAQVESDRRTPGAEPVALRKGKDRYFEAYRAGRTAADSVHLAHGLGDEPGNTKLLGVT